MAELKLKVKAELDKRSMDDLKKDVQTNLDPELNIKAPDAGDFKKENKKQTSLLDSLVQLTKAGMIMKAATMLPGAVSLGKSLIDTREGRITRALGGGRNFSDEKVDEIDKGKELNEVLDRETIMREALDQMLRLNKAQREGDTAAAEDAKKTIQDLNAIWNQSVDSSGKAGDGVDDFNDRLAEMGAVALYTGDITVEEFKKIKEKLPQATTELDKMTESSDNLKQAFIDVGLVSDNLEKDAKINFENIKVFIKDTSDPAYQLYKNLDDATNVIDNFPKSESDFPFLKYIKEAAKAASTLKSALRSTSTGRALDRAIGFVAGTNRPRGTQSGNAAGGR